MSLKLPLAPGGYDKGDQAQMRGAVERADLQNRKRQEDLVLGPGQRLVFYDERGAEQHYTGAILGGLVRSDLAAQGLSPAEQANARANIATGSGAGAPGGSGGQVQFNSGGAFGGFTVGGDASLNVLTGALTLATVNANTGVFADATHVGQFSVNGKGLVTAASSVPIAYPVTAFNARTGAITLTSADVTAALGFTPQTTAGASLLAGNGSGGFSNVTVGSGLSFSGGALAATGSLPAIASGDVLGNAGATSATASDTTLTALLDRVFGSTEGALIVRGPSIWQALAPSATAGQALCSNGAGGLPSYQAVGAGAGGALTLLETHAASSSAELDFTSWYSPRYSVYEIEINQLIPVGNNADLIIEVSTNGGSSYDTASHYEWTTWRWAYAGSGNNGQEPGASICITGAFSVMSNNTALGGASGSVKMFNPGGGSSYSRFHAVISYGATSVSSQLVGFETAANYSQATAINAFRIRAILSGGVATNLASGTVKIYGKSN